jgi:carboxypeptidase Q
MHRWCRWRLLCLVLLAVSATSAGEEERAGERERVDLVAMQRIRDEALNRGQVAEHLFWLTDANGPRLTASPGWRRAAEWAVRTLKGWGVSNARLEPWGTFGKSWSSSRATVELVSPVSASLRGYPLAWCGATPGPVTAEPVLAPLGTETEFDDMRDASKLRRHIRDFEAAWRGKLKGKLVLMDPRRDLEPPLKEPPAHRYDAPKLAELAAEIDPTPPPQWEWPLESIPADKAKRAAFLRAIPAEVAADYYARLARIRLELWDFLVKEGVAGVLLTDRRGDGGMVFAESTGAYFADAVTPPPVMVLTPESYNRVVRLLEHGLAPRLTLDVQVKVERNDAPGHTVVAEIPGGKKANETVMLGGHLDSWHTGTGATDDGAGCAVALEAFRILRTLKLPMARTVRIALWDGEEQGLYGSRGYVKQHFGDPVTMQLKSEHRSLAAYFNVDNGAGRIRGVYLQGNGMVRPIFESWMAPLRDLGVATLTNRDTRGTDHLSFDAVGLPGFQFIQDPLDYNTRTHHSELDTLDHAPAGDLMQAAAVLASFVYDAATRPEMLPRKPVPAPLPARHEPPLSAPR